MRRAARGKGATVRKQPGPKDRISGVHLSISCTDADWARIRRLADASGKTISRYLIDCAMEAAALMEKGMDWPPPGAEGLMLDEGQQQALLDGVMDLAGRLPGSGQIAEQAAMAAFLFDAVLLDMAGRGLRQERDALLAVHFGSGRGAEIAAAADRRAAERGLAP